MKKYCLMAALLAAGLLSNAAWAQAVKTVPGVDLNRYVGKWYEIARFPNRFQKSCTGNVTAQYNKRSDGEIDVINRCKEADGKMSEAIGRGRVDDALTNAKLKVRFAPEWLDWLSFVWADYWIIDLDAEYTAVAVGGPSREYLWILSRTPAMPAAAYDAMVDRVTAQGFDTAKLVKTSQEPAAK